MMIQSNFTILVIIAITTIAFLIVSPPCVDAVQAIMEQEVDRELYIIDDLFDPTEICYDAELEIFETCNLLKFPNCGGEGNEQSKKGAVVCYNRRPRRDLFYNDIRQPQYYIDYKSVLCYPEDWEGCSSCSPGRYCRSEGRCILDDLGYPCEKWL